MGTKMIFRLLIIGTTVLILRSAALAQIPVGGISDSILVDTTVFDTALIDSLVGLWYDNSVKHESPPVIEIFYTDTIGWYLDTSTVEVPCPVGMLGCLVLHWDTKIQWKPKTETHVVFTFEPDSLNHFKRWRIRRR